MFVSSYPDFLELAVSLTKLTQKVTSELTYGTFTFTFMNITC